MSNLQSDELNPVSTIDDTRKQVPLTAEEQLSLTYKNLLYAPPITTVGNETVLNWQTIPGTKKRLFETTFNVMDENQLIWTQLIDRHTSLFEEVDKIKDNYQFYDLGMEFHIEVKGNPAVVGKLTSYFAPIQYIRPDTNVQDENYIKLFQGDRCVSFLQHLELDTWTDSKATWLIPFCKPFSYFLHSDTPSPEVSFRYTIGVLNLQALTAVRCRTTEASKITVKIWGSLSINYAGARFASDPQ